MRAVLGKYQPMIYSIHRPLTCCAQSMLSVAKTDIPRGYGLNAWNQYGFLDKYITTTCKHVGVLV